MIRKILATLFIIATYILYLLVMIMGNIGNYILNKECVEGKLIFNKG